MHVCLTLEQMLQWIVCNEKDHTKLYKTLQVLLTLHLHARNIIPPFVVYREALPCIAYACIYDLYGIIRKIQIESCESYENVSYYE